MLKFQLLFEMHFTSVSWPFHGVLTVPYISSAAMFFGSPVKMGPLRKICRYKSVIKQH